MMRFPNLDQMMENLIVNHLFQQKFPFSESRETEAEEYISLCGLISFLRLLVIGNAESLTDKDSLIDLLSNAFRVITHTNFHYNVHVLLKQSGLNDPASAGGLLIL